MKTKDDPAGKVRFRKVAIGCVTLILCAPVLAYVGCVTWWQRARMEAAAHPAPPVTTWADREFRYRMDSMAYAEGKVESPADGWVTYNGTVTNRGKETVRYWKLGVKFHPLDVPKGTPPEKVPDLVVDVDHISSAETLRPGETKQWKLTHKDDRTFPMYMFEEVLLAR